MRTHLIISAVLILFIGGLTGYTVGFVRASVQRFPEFQIVEDINEGVATLKFLEVKNGELFGETAGRPFRLAYSPNDILELEPETRFSIPLDQIDLKTYYQANDLPAGTKFIASRKGKYYYSVNDKRAFMISEKNRIYFQSKEAAERQGYLLR